MSCTGIAVKADNPRNNFLKNNQFDLMIFFLLGPPTYRSMSLSNKKVIQQNAPYRNMKYTDPQRENTRNLFKSFPPIFQPKPALTN
jgi:hypothetical protein